MGVGGEQLGQEQPAGWVVGEVPKRRNVEDGYALTRTHPFIDEADVIEVPAHAMDEDREHQEWRGVQKRLLGAGAKDAGEDHGFGEDPLDAIGIAA